MTGKLHRVACAIIEKEGFVFAAQRNASGSLPLKWELPGGKIEGDETPEECLMRELREELGITVTIVTSLPEHTHHYPDFSVTLHPYVCVPSSEEITLRVHASAVWLPPQRLLTLDWAPATVPVIESYLSHLVAEHQSHCCYAHNWPYFKEPIPPYDYSDDDDLEREWKERESGKRH